MNTKTNSSGTMSGFVALIATLVLLATIILPVSALQLTGQDVSAGTIGATVEYPVILDEAPDGLAGYEITVQLADPSVGEITGATYPSWASMTGTGTLPADSVSLKAWDSADGVPGGASGGITLATLTIRADQAGTTPVTISVKRMDDDAGGIMSPTITDGSFAVAGTPEPTPTITSEPTPEITIEPTPITTQAPSHTVPEVSASVSGNTVVMNWDRIADSDLSGYKVVVSKNNPNPAYPTDGYMFWITDRETVTATLSASDAYNGGDFGGHLVPGETYYFSVTALYNDNAKIAGNVVQLTFPNDVVPTPTTTIEATPTTTQNPGPVADFTADTTSGNAPLTVQFSDASTGPIADYAWDFNTDGIIDSTEQNPTYTYADAGTFTVKLTVTGAGGSDDETKTNYITATPGPTPTPIPAPVAQFSGTPISGYAPLTVQYTDESTGIYNAIYWDFNDDLSPDSMVKNPSYTYTAPGTYNVSMLVSGPGGIDYEQKFGYIVVTAEPVPAPVAQFTAQPTTGDSPLTVTFTDASTGSITGYSWDFENNGIPDSTEKNPEHTYTLPGTYAVNLTVTGPGGADDETKLAYITVSQPPAKPVANFSAAPLQGVAPMVVTFTDTSSGSAITAWAWDFESDGSIDSTEQNPRHDYLNPGVYSVTQTVTSAAGSDTKTAQSLITVTEPAPVARFSAEPLTGTIPLRVNFTDASANAASYAWDFENDGIIDSAEKNPGHIYTAAGTYTVNLTVANTAASASEVKTAYITAKTGAPRAEFSAEPLSGTAPLKVNFTDASAGDSISAWSWDFNTDGIADSIDQNPVFVYDQPGTYNVSLMVTNDGGSDAVTREQYITVRMAAPVANFTANQTTGYAPLLVEFADASTGSVASYAWDFENDGTVDSTEQNPVHTYAAAGNYTVNLTVANEGGSSGSVKTDYIIVNTVPAPVVDFSANLTAGMAPFSVQFTDESKGIGLISWSWDFNGDNIVDSIDQNPAYTFANPGNYTVSLVVKGTGGTITTTKTDYIIVSAVPPEAPKAEFAGKPTSGKAPLVVKFTDKSVGKNITAWAWDFNGDGITDSIEQNPGYTYTTKGNYNVSLTVTNAGGSNSKAKKAYIRVSQLEKPQADFKADKQSGNAPLTVKFTDTSKGDSITEWSWDFNNDGIIDSTQKNPTYTYATAGKYAVKLVVTNAAGSDMEVRSDFITVKGSSQLPAGKKPVAVIFADKTWGTPPMTVKFADQSLNNPASRTWYFGDGSSSTEANPTHLYADPGIYFARLYVESPAGTDQDFRFIFVLPKWLALWSGK